MKTFFQITGIVALVGWTVLGGVAWFMTKEGVDVRLQEGSGASENLALLDDRLDNLSNDIDLLVASLEANFGLLAEALDGSVTTEDLARLRTEERLGHLEGALPEALVAREVTTQLQARLAELDRALGKSLDLQQALQATPAQGSMPDYMVDWPAESNSASEPLAQNAQPTAEVAAPAETVSEAIGEVATDPQLASAAESQVEVERESATPTPPPKKSFFAFTLPSRDFQFEGEQSFEVLDGLSRVGFDAKSTLHDFTGVSDQVAGSFRVDLSNTAAGISGEVRIQSATLGTGLEGRDDEMKAHLDVATYAEIRFVPTGFTAVEVDVTKQTIAGDLTGEMTIRGVTRSVTLPIKGSVDDSRRLVVEGEMPLLLTDYDVPVPNKLGMISVDDQVRVWIVLRTRAKAVKQ